MALTGARADGPDDQYVTVYNTIQEADALNSGGQSSRALPKYREAETALLNFQKGYPDWNTSVVEFRLRYVRTAISALLAKGPESTAPAQAAPSPTRPAAPGTAPAAPAPNWQNQVNTLTDQLHRLQDDNASLQAKLKEALASQPGVTDPRQLAQADEKIKNLQKEKELLQVSLEQEKAKAASGAANQALEQARKALAQAGRDLDEQTKKANALEKEKTGLQNKLNNLPASSYNDTENKTLRKDLEAANRKLAEQTKLASDLANEKQAMQASFKTMKADSEAAQALRSENQSLKKQVADLESSQQQLKSAQAAGPATAPLTAKQEESKRVKKLQQERDELRKQLELAQADVKSVRAEAKTAAAATTTQEESKRIKKLQQERDELRKQLEAANQDLKTRKGKASPARVLELEKQMASMRAKLDVLEATPVPYTAEEVALFRAPAGKPLETVSKPAAKASKELPADSVALYAEAKRYYTAGQLDKAEDRYQQVLREDQTHVPTLANLAAVELELKHLPQAETNIMQALALAPDDPACLVILGRLRYQQANYDAALDALSRAAKAEPKSAEVQNYLGITLSAKGLRGPGRNRPAQGHPTCPLLP